MKNLFRPLALLALLLVGFGQAKADNTFKIVDADANGMVTFEHGTVTALIQTGETWSPSENIAPGTTVKLTYQAAQGYALGSIKSYEIDNTSSAQTPRRTNGISFNRGEEVPVTWDGNLIAYTLTMPESNVEIEAVFKETHAITLVVDQKFSGYVTLLRETAPEGANVTVMYYPNQVPGYEFKSLTATYTDANSQTQTLDMVDDEYYFAEGRLAKKFVMPDYPVTVTAVFEIVDLAYAVYTNNDTEVTFYYDQLFEERNAQYSIYYVNDGHLEVHYGKSSKLTTATIDASMANYTGLASLASCFSNCGNLTQISGLNYLNTANVTDMSYLFYKCDDLTQVDISSFNTASVTTMERMFDFDGNSMQSLAIGSGFTVGANTNIDYIFGIVSAWCPKTVYIHGTTEPDIKQNIFAKFDQESYVLQTDEGITLTGTQIDDENYKFIYKGGKFTSYNGKHFVTQYDPKYFVATPVFAAANETVTVTIASAYAGQLYVPKGTYGTNWPLDQVEMTKTDNGYTFIMVDEEVTLEPITFTPVLRLNDAQTTLTFLAMDATEAMHSQQGQQQGIQQMIYMLYANIQANGTDNLSENELAFINACYGKVKTVVFDESLLYTSAIDGSRLLKGFSKLTTITGLDNLNMQNFSSTTEMFSGCASLASLTIGSNFFIGQEAVAEPGQQQQQQQQQGFDATDMFAGCTALATGTITVTGVPTIEQDIFSDVITKGTLLTDPEDLLGDAVTEETDYFLWKGGHFVKYNSQEIVKGETLTFAAEQEWGTYFTDASDLALPEGMTAYYVSGVSLDANGETGTMTLASTGTKLYKNVPTLIQRASTTQALEAVAEQATYTDGETIRGAMHGYFHGTAVGETFQQQAANMNTFFVLRDGAFIKATPTTIAAHRCWLAIPKGSGQSAQSASSLVFNIIEEGNTTGVNDVRSKMEDVRGEYYNLAGQRVAQPTKGIYISNGKKVIVK